MNKLEPKYQLNFPSKKEVRIAYQSNDNLIVGQLAKSVFGLSWIFIFISIFAGFFIWNLCFILFGIMMVSGIVQSKFPSNSLKEVILKPDFFEYKYAVGANNREKRIVSPMFIDFRVDILSDMIKVSFMDIVVDLYKIDDLPVFVDNVAAMFDMKYIDTCRLSNHQEILMYQRKSLSNIIYPTLINVVQQSNGVEFYDMANQYFWLKFDELHQHIYHYDPEFRLPKLMILYSDVRQIDITLNAGKWVENRIIINVTLNNNTKKTVFETTVRTKDKKLTSYRDVNLIFMEIEKLPHLKSIKITKQFNIQ